MTKAKSGENPPDLAAVAEAAEQAGGRTLPPVHLWTPPLSGVMDLTICRDGRWVHEGREITREGLVRLFASILKREGDDHFLVTPVEKWQITVEDAPFVVVDLEATGMSRAQEVRFTTNLGDSARIDADHPLRMGAQGVPYVTLRRGLDARLDRKSFYRLVSLGQVFDDMFGVWSGGTFFPMMAASELDA